jgi:TatD DNase family protein
MFIDTHSHLYLEQFDTDISDVILRAKECNIEKIYLPNIDSTTIDDMLNLEKMEPNLFRSMIGLHPSSVNKNFQKELDLIFSTFEEHKFSAVGEIGIDLYWDTTYYKEQIEALEFQVDFAKLHNLPVILHTRNSIDETISIIEKKQKGDLKGIFHCFSGNLKQAHKIIDLGFYLGVGGVISYKKNELIPVIESVSLDNIVLETDSPYLPPVPYRGKRNESSYIILVAEKIAELKKIDMEEVGLVTSTNSNNIFRK